MITTSDIVVIVKRKLGSRVTITDENILLYVQELEQEIKNYCHIESVPDELKYT